MNSFRLTSCALLLFAFTSCAYPPAQMPAGTSTAGQSTPRVQVDVPWQLIGMKLADADVQAYLDRASSEPDREVAPGYGVFVSLYRDGVDISADTDELITTVIIYSALGDKYQPYVGRMPRSLTWKMTRGEVEKVLGEPARHSFTRNSVTGRYEYFSEYPELEMYLNFDATSETDLQARLIDIRIKNARL